METPQHVLGGTLPEGSGAPRRRGLCSGSLREGEHPTWFLRAGAVQVEMGGCVWEVCPDRTAPRWESAWSLRGRGSLGAIQRLVPGSQGTLKEGFVLHRPLCGELCLRAGTPPPLLGGCVPASSPRAVGPGGRFACIAGMSCFQ